MQREGPENLDDDPKGHPPMQIEYRGGKMWLMPENVEIAPHVPVGPEEHHRRLFIEYERTFGRGLAKDVTHQVRSAGNRGRIWQEVIGEYRAIAAEFNQVARNGTPEEARALSVKIKAFRRNHPDLYEDVSRPSDEPTKPRVRIVED